LREKNRFEDIASCSGEWIWEIDTKGKFTYVTGKVKSLLGYEPKEMIGKTPFDFMPQNEKKRIQKFFLKTSQQKKPLISLETWHIAKTGKKVCFLTNGNPILSKNGELLGYRGVGKDITDQKQAEQAVRKHILDAITNTSEQLLKSSSWDEHIQTVLEELGAAVDVSRVYVFQNFVNDKKQLATKQLYEWVAKGVTSQIDNKELQNFPWKEGGLGRWAKLMSKGDVVKGFAKDFPKSEQAVLGQESILSILVVPIFVNGKWWGAIGFDDCKNRREWLLADTDVLRSVANIVGVAIERDNSVQEFKQLYQDMQIKNEELGRFNELMVGREIKMMELKEQIKSLKEKCHT
ncbi:PAS domain S-box protein, partial [Patescibacteria group bacterium]